MEGSFFNIENLKKNCIRTLLRDLNADAGATGKIFSEGCYAMEIINYSDIQRLNLTINGQSLILFPAVDIGGGPGPYIRPGGQNIFLPGEPYLVQSNIITFSWDDPETPDEWNAVVIRHMVVPFQEGVSYPVYTGKK